VAWWGAMEIYADWSFGFEASEDCALGLVEARDPSQLPRYEPAEATVEPRVLWPSAIIFCSSNVRDWWDLLRRGRQRARGLSII